jgi:threonine/homoserine/homoserine lactone efflux protein
MQLLALGAVQKGTGFVILSATALAAGHAGDWISKRRRWLAWQSRCVGMVMVILGCRLLFGGGSRPS